MNCNNHGTKCHILLSAIKQEVNVVLAKSAVWFCMYNIEYEGELLQYYDNNIIIIRSR